MYLNFIVLGFTSHTKLKEDEVVVAWRYRFSHRYNGIENAILAHNCNAVFHAAGVAQQWGHSKTGEYNTIFAAVVTAIVEARKERGGPAIRAWLIINPLNLIGDYMPMFPEHRKNLALIQSQSGENIAWSLFCASGMTLKHGEIQIPAPGDCSADNVIAKADSPPGWRNTLHWVPLIGNYLNIIAQAGGYMGTIKDPIDFIAADFKKGLHSEFVGKRVGFKLKEKVK
ncbi:hypothetical protein BX600DRAFT_437277 [Xylariales sp. PMI_506]|nr:hypothetical protein BX600DRAFT_437277 [Xylariales sp. PMI_506]